MAKTIFLADDAFIILSDRTRRLMRRKAQLVRKGVLFGRFRNGEVRINVQAGVKGKAVVLFKSCVNHGIYEPNTAYLELFLANDALKRAGARRIINVVPYIPYLRQDRVAHPGEPVSAKLFAWLTYRSGASMVITVDPHSAIVLPYYSRGRMIASSALFADHLKRALPGEAGCVIVAPDLGAKQRAAIIAKRLGLPLAVCEKKRDAKGKIISLQCRGLRQGMKHAIIYDDMIDSGGTLFRTVDVLKRSGIRQFTFCCTHAVLSGDAERELKRRRIRLITTDSIPLRRKGVTMLSLAPVLAAALDSVIR